MAEPVQPWFPLPAAAWPEMAAILTASGRPWPRECILADLRWWADRERMGRGARPGRPALAARWGIGEKAARLVIAAEDEWADPRFAGASEGPAKGQRRASEGPARGQKVTRKATESQEQGASEGPARGQRRASEGPAKGQPTALEKGQESPSNSPESHEAGASLTCERARGTQAQAQAQDEDQILEDSRYSVERGSTVEAEPGTQEEHPGHIEAKSTAATASPQEEHPLKTAPHWTVTLWDELQAIRAEHQPKARSQLLTAKRKANLTSRTAELRTAGMTREDLLRAAEWVFTAPNIRAEGARKTGDALEVLLRPAHCVTYCELAEQEARQPPAVRSPMQTGSPNGTPEPRALSPTEQALADLRRKRREQQAAASPDRPTLTLVEAS